MREKLVVVGGGAAGFFCAVNAARLAPTLDVMIVEKTSKLLQKVKVSGGGRCNVTHWGKSKSEMAKCYPRGEKFCKKLFSNFFVDDTIAWFKERGVQLKHEEDGRMFPITNQSSTIIDCLLEEAKKFKVVIRNSCGITSIAEHNNRILLHTGNDAFAANYLCIATGGNAYVQQFDWITQPTGHKISPPVPSLFTFNLANERLTQLPGIAVQDAVVRIRQTAFESRGPLLITHWGISGPAVLRTSAFAARWLHQNQYQYEVVVNWLPQFHEQQLLEKIRAYRNEKANQKVVNTPWLNLPERLLDLLLKQSGGDADMVWGAVPAAVQNRLVRNLCNYELKASGKTTFKEEFVTAGGIVLDEIEPATMGSKLFPNLFFAGEVIDVDGITGGFNFQHVWSSGMQAARAIAARHYGQ